MTCDASHSSFIQNEHLGGGFAQLSYGTSDGVFLPTSKMTTRRNNERSRERERVLFIGTQFSILYTFMYSPA
jgi:hypothetical protein